MHASPEGGRLILNSIYLLPAAPVFQKNWLSKVFYEISEILSVDN